MAPRVLTTSCSMMPRAASSGSPEIRWDRAGFGPRRLAQGLPSPLSHFPSSPLELYLFLERFS